MPAYSAGALRHSVVLEQRAQFTGAELSLKSSFKPVGSAWAEIEGVGGAMYLDSLQIEEKITHRIVIRYRPRTDFDHIRCGNRRFRLRNTRDPKGDRRWLQMEAEEIEPGDDTL